MEFNLDTPGGIPGVILGTPFFGISGDDPRTPLLKGKSWFTG